MVWQSGSERLAEKCVLSLVTRNIDLNGLAVRLRTFGGKVCSVVSYEEQRQFSLFFVVVVA